MKAAKMMIRTAIPDLMHYSELPGALDCPRLTAPLPLEGLRRLEEPPFHKESYRGRHRKDQEKNGLLIAQAVTGF